MLCGYPPFYSEDPNETCEKIISWRQHFSIPDDIDLSPAAVDILTKLITDVENRLGYHGAAEIKRHPFFKGVDWANIRSSVPSFVPEIESEYDNKYFDDFEEDDPFYPDGLKGILKPNKDVCFINFNYKRENDNRRLNFEVAIDVLDSLKKDEVSRKVESMVNERCHTEESFPIKKKHLSALPVSTVPDTLKSFKTSSSLNVRKSTKERDFRVHTEETKKIGKLVEKDMLRLKMSISKDKNKGEPKKQVISMQKMKFSSLVNNKKSVRKEEKEVTREYLSTEPNKGNITASLIGVMNHGKFGGLKFENLKPKPVISSLKQKASFDTKLLKKNVKKAEINTKKSKVEDFSRRAVL